MQRYATGKRQMPEQHLAPPPRRLVDGLDLPKQRSSGTSVTSTVRESAANSSNPVSCVSSFQTHRCLLFASMKPHNVDLQPSCLAHSFISGSPARCRRTTRPRAVSNSSSSPCPDSHCPWSGVAARGLHARKPVRCRHTALKRRSRHIAPHILTYSAGCQAAVLAEALSANSGYRHQLGI